MELNSCLYECEVMHYRLKPKKYKLVHKVFMFYLDLDELDLISKNFFWIKNNKLSFYSFWDKDHLQVGGNSAKENIQMFLKQQGFDETIEKVFLLTNLRTLGHVFNPVSFYFCYNAFNQIRAAVVEIGNTFGELKPYYISPRELTGSIFDAIREKAFYISPYAHPKIQMQFKLSIPDENLDIRVQDIEENDKFLYATLFGKRKFLNNLNLFWCTLKFPLITLKVIGLIHWHAFVLWLKGLPFYIKEENIKEQKGVLRVYKNTAQKYDKLTS